MIKMKMDMLHQENKIVLSSLLREVKISYHKDQKEILQTMQSVVRQIFSFVPYFSCFIVKKHFDVCSLLVIDDILARLKHKNYHQVIGWHRHSDTLPNQLENTCAAQSASKKTLRCFLFFNE